MLKLSQGLAALSALVLLSGTAMAIEPPYATYDIRLEANPAQNMVLSPVLVGPAYEKPVAKETVAFRIVNNTGKEVYFVNGDEKHYIPLISQNTVTAPYSTGTYKAVDVEGNTVATWQLASESGHSANVTAASKEQFSQWGQTLQSVIASAQNRTVSYANQPEPMYTNQPATTTRGAAVRGFW